MKVSNLVRSFIVVFAITFAGVSTAAPIATKSVAGRSNFWVGSALDGVFGPSTTVPSLSATWVLNEKSALQFYFGMTTINPLVLGGGAQFKQTIVGNSFKGFHVGGGVGLGVVDAGIGQTFYINIAPGAGLHFEVVDNVMFSFDASFAIKIQTAGANNVDLALAGNSGLLGASVVFGL